MRGSVRKRPDATRSVVKPGAAMLVMAALVACSKAEKTPSQVVASAGGTEITLSMLQTELNGLPEGVDRRDPAVQRDVLNRMVTEALFAKAAEDNKLDRKPGVDQDIAKARRAVLANAYVASLSPGRRPGNAEVEGYFAEHPELFAERRRYKLTLLPVTAAQQDVARYVSVFRDNDQRGELLSAMQGNGIPAALTVSTGAADQMPTALAKKLLTMKQGDRFTYREGPTQVFVWIDEVTAAPVPMAVARDSIAAYLARRARNTSAQAEAASLRSGDAVQYGDVGKRILAGTSPASTDTGKAAPASNNDQVKRGLIGL